MPGRLSSSQDLSIGEAAARAAEFETHFRQFGGTIFVAAETRRLHEAEDSRVAQGIHRLCGHALGLFRCKRP